MINEMILIGTLSIIDPREISLVETRFRRE
jgi:hypothetical protein